MQDVRFSIAQLDDSDLAPRWSELIRAGNFNPTLGPDWIAVAARALARSPDDLRVLVRRNADGNVTAALPHYRSRRRFLGIECDVLESGANLMSYHAEIVAEGEVDSVLGALVTAVHNWDVLHFANVLLGSTTDRALSRLADDESLFMQVIRNQDSPYLSINATWDGYLATRNKKFRYKLRHRRQEITADARYRLAWLVSPADVERLLEDILAVERVAWKQDAGTSILKRPQELRYHQELLPFLARRQRLLASVLYHDQQPIAYSLCCQMNGWIGHLKTSFDTGFARLSPGSFVIDACVQKAFELRAREFDFLGEADPHKTAWTSMTRPHADFYLFGRTWRGRLLGAIKRLKLPAVFPATDTECRHSPTLTAASFEARPRIMRPERPSEAR